MIIARPNQSATWRANLYTLLALCIPSFGVAIGFAALGAWPILPFAGLEMLALGSALYYVNWKLQYRHVITLSDEAVRIDKGYYAPRQSWTFLREETDLAITPEKHPWEGPELCVHNRHQQVSIGEFLNRDDCLQLAGLLCRELRVGTHSPRTRRSF
jgi:uncharacterized membrane protein